MTDMVLKRVAQTDDGTFGVLIRADLGHPFALTLERPWRDNRTGESCIPSGGYDVIRCSHSPDYGYRDSPKFGDTFQVFNVPGRSYILFHKGNLQDDTHGCILVGEAFNYLGGKPGVTASRDGFREFLEINRGVPQWRLQILDFTTAPGGSGQPA